MLTNRIQSNLANARLILHSAGLDATEARQVIRTEDHTCLLDRVRIDVWDFLDAQRAANRDCAAGRQAEAIAAYHKARTLYAGPLLRGQEDIYLWLNERVDGGLTLREAYHSQWRQLCERLAGLVTAAGRHADAASIYRQLVVDRLALPTVDNDVAEQREAHACALIATYRALRDPGGIEQTAQDRRLAFEHDDLEGAAASPTRPTSQTVLSWNKRARSCVVALPPRSSAIQASRRSPRPATEPTSCTDWTEPIVPHWACC